MYETFETITGYVRVSDFWTVLSQELEPAQAVLEPAPEGQGPQD